MCESEKGGEVEAGEGDSVWRVGEGCEGAMDVDCEEVREEGVRL